MLHCNMTNATSLQLGLDDLLAEFRHARRCGDLGRLALIAYCDVRRWARQAGEMDLAAHAATMFTAEPHASRDDFLGQVDRLMLDLETTQARRYPPQPTARETLSERAGEQHASCE